MNGLSEVNAERCFFLGWWMGEGLFFFSNIRFIKSLVLNMHTMVTKKTEPFTCTTQEELDAIMFRGVQYSVPLEYQSWASGVKRLLKFGLVPASMDDLVEQRYRKVGGSDELYFSGTLRFQIGSGKTRKMSFGDFDDIDLWHELSDQLSDNQNFVDLSRDNKSQAGLIKKLEKVLNRGNIIVPSKNPSFSTKKDSAYKNDAGIKAMMPKNADLNRRLLARYNYSTAQVLYSRADLSDGVVRVGPVWCGGVGDGIGSGVVGADGGFVDGRSRGKLPVGAQK